MSWPCRTPSLRGAISATSRLEPPARSYVMGVSAAGQSIIAHSYAYASTIGMDMPADGRSQVQSSPEKNESRLSRLVNSTTMLPNNATVI